MSITRCMYQYSVRQKAKTLQLRLKKSGYSEGRILKAVIQFKNKCYFNYSLNIIRKEIIKTIARGNDYTRNIEGTFCFSDDDKLKFSKILMEEHPSISDISVYSGAYGSVSIIITP